MGFSGGSLGAAYPSRGSYVGKPITAVSFNQSLLTPLNVKIDPSIQAVRVQEKDQILKLNNRFASFIDKVRHLEQQNKMLEAKWQVLNAETRPPSKCEPLLKAHIQGLETQLQQLALNKQHLHTELRSVHEEVEDKKQQYEVEINRRSEAENEFVLLKKDVDGGYMLHTDLEVKLANMIQDINLFKTLYDEERRELEAEMRDVSVTVEMDNSRALDMQQIVSEVKAQYADVSSRSRQDAEAWYQTKFDQVSAQADHSSEELRISKQEIADFKRLITRLHNEISGVKAQCATLDAQIADSENQGEAALKDAHVRIHQLEEALQNAKQDMAKQLRDYQKLMDIKLALDIEIATYYRLLEGEENRIGQDHVVNVRTSSHRSTPHKMSAPKVLIKVTETQDSHTSS
ncbi:intermediate filament protein ON3 [Clupea harengus]|uniref:Intermediate filament protein ON3 n=1 Tax=Clupea harengus TaxID=7950 RepID=A0A6P8GFR5_CLUHA|nr:intermediate filament protein ON3 [Clupea harengus]